mmetsp:Transcript_11372/g.37636  ORF Transcript_11372/g.37636 Transcript_11372/m.37636 type:complete len:234 (+) Transcript_11372:195-896(+)
MLVVRLVDGGRVRGRVRGCVRGHRPAPGRAQVGSAWGLPGAGTPRGLAAGSCGARRVAAAHAHPAISHPTEDRQVFPCILPCRLAPACPHSRHFTPGLAAPHTLAPILATAHQLHHLDPAPAHLPAQLHRLHPIVGPAPAHRCLLFFSRRGAARRVERPSLLDNPSRSGGRQGDGAGDAGAVLRLRRTLLGRRPLHVEGFRRRRGSGARSVPARPLCRRRRGRPVCHTRRCEC